ncbi:hypothetical protein JCM3770_002267 [Rhodotorula araucariae]
MATSAPQSAPGPGPGPSTAVIVLSSDDHDDDSVFSASSDGDASSNSDDESLLAQQRRRGAAKRMHAVEGLYKGDAVLPTEEFGSLAVLDIYRMIKGGVINTTPDYQREVVWPAEHVTGLIESILRNMHVPELLFNVYTPQDTRDKWYRLIRPAMQIRPAGRAELPERSGEESDADDDDEEERVVRQVWNCADGKQRMTAIMKFIDDEVAVKGESGKMYTYSMLPPSARDVFNSKRLRYGFFRELSDRQEREIFKRVQRGKALDKGEVLNAIDTGYSDWVRELLTEFLGSDDRSLRPRILRGERGAALTGVYQASRNILIGVDKMKSETDVRRKATLEQQDPPKRGQRDKVLVTLRRFRDLTCVPPLEGEDRWPDTTAYDDLRGRGVPVPHRVWRLRPEMVPAKRKAKSKRAGEAVTFAPVELHILPAVLHRFRELSDGDLLELVEMVRIHIHDKLTGEVKDNSKTYDLVKRWIKDFDISDLAYKYNNDGSLRDGSKRASTRASFGGTDASTSGRKPPRNESSAVDAGGKKRSATVAGSVESSPEGSGSGSVAKKARTTRGSAPAGNGGEDKGKGKECEQTPSAAFSPAVGGGAFTLPTQRGGGGARPRAAMSESPAAGIGAMPFGVPSSLAEGGGTVGHYGDTSSSTSGRVSAAGKDDAFPPVPPPAASLSEKPRKSAARADGDSRSGTSGRVSAAGKDGTFPPAPSPAAGLSQKQRKFAARAAAGSVFVTAPAAPAVSGSSSRAAGDPGPPAPAPSAPQLLQPKPKPKGRVRPPPRKGPRQYDERGREIITPFALGPSVGGRALLPSPPPGFAENDAMHMSNLEADAFDDVAGGGLTHGAAWVGAPPVPRPADVDKEMQEIIFARQHAPEPSFAQQSARAAAQSGRRVPSGDGARVKRDPDDEERGATLALSGCHAVGRDGRDDELRAALAPQGSRAGSRQPYEHGMSRPLHDTRDRDRDRDWDWNCDDGYPRDRYHDRESRDGYRSEPRDEYRSERRGDYRSDRRDDYYSDRWDDYRSDRRDGRYRVEDRRDSDGYDRYRRDKPLRSQSSAERLASEQQPPREAGSSPSSRTTRLPRTLPAGPNGTGYPPFGADDVATDVALAAPAHTYCTAPQPSRGAGYDSMPPRLPTRLPPFACVQPGERLVSVDSRPRPGQG